MDAGNSQVKTRPLIEADFGDNGGRVAFASINEAIRIARPLEWIEHEIAVWRKFWNKIEIGRLVPNVGEHQLKLPATTKIREALNDAEHRR